MYVAFSAERWNVLLPLQKMEFFYLFYFFKTKDEHKRITQDTFLNIYIYMHLQNHPRQRESDFLT